MQDAAKIREFHQITFSLMHWSAAITVVYNSWRYSCNGDLVQHIGGAHVVICLPSDRTDLWVVDVPPSVSKSAPSRWLTPQKHVLLKILFFKKSILYDDSLHLIVWNSVSVTWVCANLRQQRKRGDTITAVETLNGIITVIFLLLDTRSPAV